jgi:hypothetical protein
LDDRPVFPEERRFAEVINLLRPLKMEDYKLNEKRDKNINKKKKMLIYKI